MIEVRVMILSLLERPATSAPPNQMNVIREESDRHCRDVLTMLRRRFEMDEPSPGTDTRRVVTVHGDRRQQAILATLTRQALRRKSYRGTFHNIMRFPPLIAMFRQRLRLDQTITIVDNIQRNRQFSLNLSRFSDQRFLFSFQHR